MKARINVNNKINAKQVGIQGPPGPTGPQGERGIVWRGEYNNAISYDNGDAVEYNNSSYICVVDGPILGINPENDSVWDVISLAGGSGVPLIRTFATGTGLSGGGDFSEDRILFIEDTGVTAGSYGATTSIPIITVNAQGQITDISTSNVEADAISSISYNPRTGTFLLETTTGQSFEVLIDTTLTRYTTDNLVEGDDNLYYTNEKVRLQIRQEISKALIDHLDVDAVTLSGQTLNEVLTSNSLHDIMLVGNQTDLEMTVGAITTPSISAEELTVSGDVTNVSNIHKIIPEGTEGQVSIGGDFGVSGDIFIAGDPDETDNWGLITASSTTANWGLISQEVTSTEDWGGLAINNLTQFVTDIAISVINTNINNAAPETRGVVYANTSDIGTNVSLGYQALDGVIQEGGRTDNVAIGIESMRFATQVDRNTAVGFGSLRGLTSGSENVAIGRNALRNASNTSQTVSVGGNSGFSLTTALRNIFVGHSAGFSTTTGDDNVAIGRNSLYDNVSGIQNTGLGTGTLAQSTGNKNTAVGYNTGRTITSGENNILIGHDVNTPNPTDSNMIVMGNNQTTRLRIQGIGLDTAAASDGYVPYWDADGGISGTGGFNWRSIDSIAVGDATFETRGVVFGHTDGNTDVSYGYRAMASRTIDNRNNTAIGFESMFDLTSGTNNVAVGNRSLFNLTTGTENVAVGRNALRDTTESDFNIALGTNALLVDTTGHSNVAIGYSTMVSNLDGNLNVGLGRGTLGAMTTGNENMAIGYNTLFNMTSGSGNTAIGSQALDDLTTGNYNIAIGLNAGRTLNSGNNNIAIGLNAQPSGATVSNEVTIGDVNITRFRVPGIGFDTGTASDNQYLRWNSTLGDLQWVDLDLITQDDIDASIAAVIDSAPGALDTLNEIAAALGDDPNFATTITNQLALKADITYVDDEIDTLNTNLTATLASKASTSYVDSQLTAKADITYVNSEISDVETLISTKADTTYVNNQLALKADITYVDSEITTLDTNLTNYIDTEISNLDIQVDPAEPLSSGTVFGISNLGENSVALGYNSLRNQVYSAGVSGYENTAIGRSAGNNITTGYNNTTLGYSAGSGIQAGHQNVFVGARAGESANGAIENVGVGKNALRNVTATNNTALGNFAGTTLSTGVENVFIGRNAGKVQTTSNNNVLIGTNSGIANVDGADNVFVGHSSGVALTTGDKNVFIGKSAASSLTDGDNNIVIGFGAATSGTTGISNEITIGTNDHTRFRIPGLFLDTNTATDGYYLSWDDTGGAGGTGGFTWIKNIEIADHNTQGILFGFSSNISDEVSLGFNALPNKQGGYPSNIGIGNSSLSLNTTGSNNIAIGSEALRDNVSNDNNVAIGKSALRDSDGGEYNIAIGNSALVLNTIGNQNVAIGPFALDSNTSGSFNFGLGNAALTANTTGSNNVAIGINALISNTTSDSSVAVGDRALQNSTGRQNTAIGSSAGDNITTGFNNTVIGNAANSSSPTVNNEITFGDSSVTRFRIPGLELDTGDAADEQLLIWNSLGGVSSTGAFEWIDKVDLTGLFNIKEDTTPQLGGDLDTNFNSIVGSTVTLKPTSKTEDSPLSELVGGEVNIQGGDSTATTAGDARGGRVIINGGSATAAGTATPGAISIGTDGTKTSLISIGSDDIEDGINIYSPGNALGFKVRQYDAQVTPVANTLIYTYLAGGTTPTLELGGYAKFPTADGTNGYVLTTDGAGNLSWTTKAVGASFDGSFSSLTDIPTTIAGYGITDAFDGAYSSLTGAPSLATVATSGAYSDLTGTPSIPSTLTDLSIVDGTNGQVLSTDGAGTFSFINVFDGSYSSLTGAPSLATVATSGAYSDLTGTPSVPSTLTDLGITDGTNAQVLSTDGAGTFSFVDVFDGAYSSLTGAPSLATVATSGDYNDLSNLPSIPSALTDLGITDGTNAQVLSTNGSGTFSFVDVFDGAYSSLTGAPTLSTVATSGDYNDLSNLPSIPSTLTDLSISDGTNGQVLSTNGSGTFSFISPFDGAYSSLTGTPTTLAGYGITDGLSEIVEDTSPALGGNLNVNGRIIGGTTNITIKGDTNEGTGDRTGRFVYIEGGAATSTNGGNAEGGRVFFDGGVATSNGGTTTGGLVNIGTIEAKTSQQVNIGNAGLADGIRVFSGEGVNGFRLFATEKAPATPGNKITIQSYVNQTSGLAELRLHNQVFPYSTGTNGQVLKTNGGNLMSWYTLGLLDLGISDGSTGQALITDGFGNFSFADVFDGAYSSLTGAPSIPSALTDLSISDGTNGQVLSTDGAGTFSFIDVFDGAYSSLTGAPSLSTVATSGAYSDLTGTPSIPSTLTDLGITDGTNAQVLSTNGAGTFSFVDVFDGNYNNLSNLPTLFDGAYSSLTGAPTLSAVATSGDYSDLANAPSIPAVLTDLGITDGADSQVLSTNGLGTFTFVDVFDGSYDSLTDVPTFATVATSGDYADLSNAPASILDFSISDGTNGQVLSTDGAGTFSFVDNGIANVVEDTTPQLGGDLDTNGNKIVGEQNIYVRGSDKSGAGAQTGTFIYLEAGNATSSDGGTANGGRIFIDGGSASSTGSTLGGIVNIGTQTRTSYAVNFGNNTLSDGIKFLPGNNVNGFRVRQTTDGTSDTEVTTLQSYSDGTNAILKLQGMRFPDSDGTAGQIITTNGFNILSWTDPFDEDYNSLSNLPDLTDIVCDSIQLTGGTGTQGTFTWNADEETIDLNEGNAVLQLGQEIHVHVRNNSGSSIANGTVVMATGTVGASGRITVSPSTTSDPKFVLGVTTETIANDSDGKVTFFGKVREIDTSGFSEGDVLYVDTSDGSLTATEPVSGLILPVAFVISSHASTGTIMVRVTPHDERVDNLALTALQSVAFGDLTSTPTTLAGYGITDSPSDLTDLGITDGTNGQVLSTDGAGNFSFVDQSGGGGGLANVVEDTTPQLGGDLDTNGNKIVGTSNIYVRGTAKSGTGVQTGTFIYIEGGDATSSDNNAAGGRVFIDGGQVSATGTATTGIVNVATQSARTGLLQLGNNASADGIKIFPGNANGLRIRQTTDGTSGTEVSVLESYTNGTDALLKIQGQVFPTSDGTNGQVLSTNGSNQLSWTDVFDGDYTNLTNKPTIPTDLTDLSITDGTDGQVLTTDGAGNFAFETVSGGGASSATQTTEGTVYGRMSSSHLNTAVGYQASNSITTGSVTAFGAGAAKDLTTAPECTAIGENAMENNVASGYNIAIGRNAMRDVGNGGVSTSGRRNAAIGSNCCRFLTTGEENIGIGDSTMFNLTTGSYNMGIGRSALATITTASGNVAVGSSALNLTTASNNVAIGKSAGYRVSTGQQNVLIGEQAGRRITTGNFNTYIGPEGVGGGLGDGDISGSRNTVLGYGAKPSTSSVSNEITLGDANTGALRCQQTSITSLSDGRDKKDVIELPVGLDFINKLKPVEFIWNTRDGVKVDQKDTGFIAQDLQQAQEDESYNIPGLVYEENPDKLEASYGKLIPTMVKAIQDLSKQVEELQNKIKSLEEQ